ncbi:hypothetical protein PLUTE_a4075 [Pseudoalteromonas luteoviolacea DSM 6061]|nr:hypothetical protein [Pseudoalteromonas luteoviolacea DSM 6061]
MLDREKLKGATNSVAAKLAINQQDLTGLQTTFPRQALSG